MNQSEYVKCIIRGWEFNNVWYKQNKMASVNTCFKMAIKTTLNDFLLQMLRLSILEFTSCSWTKLWWMVCTSCRSDWTFSLIHFQTRSICLNLQSWTKLFRKFWFWTYCNHNYDKLGLVFVQKCPPPPPPWSILLDKTKLVKPGLINIGCGGEGVAARVRYWGRSG